MVSPGLNDLGLRYCLRVQKQWSSNSQHERYPPFVQKPCLDDSQSELFRSKVLVKCAERMFIQSQVLRVRIQHALHMDTENIHPKSRLKTYMQATRYVTEGIIRQVIL